MQYYHLRVAGFMIFLVLEEIFYPLKVRLKVFVEVFSTTLTYNSIKKEDFFKKTTFYIIRYFFRRLNQILTIYIFINSLLP